MLASLIASIVVAASPQEDSLTGEHRRWLEEDVRYIITDEERAFFQSLATVEERERAIEAFWDNRDPDRLTPENEFRDEHYRRIEEANRLFGRRASRAGHLTERGELFILLGPPERVEPHVGSNEVVDCEIWFYNGDHGRGFPPRFNLVFFREDDLGEYRLYSPLDDGPSALVRARMYLYQDRSAAIDVLESVSIELARASLTVDLTEAVGSFLGRFTGVTADGRREDPTIPLNVRPSASSNLYIGVARESGRAGVDTDYIDGYRRYGSRVSTEYSFKYISNRDYWTVLYEPSGAPFLHYSIELDPQDMTFRRNEDGSTYKTRLQVDVEVSDRAGGAVAIPRREPHIRLTAEQIEVVKTLPVSFQDSFPLIPGAYQVTVTLRNLAGEHFTVAERNLSVAEPRRGPSLGGVAVGYDVVSLQEQGSFASLGSRVLPSGDARFPKGGTVHAFAQSAPDATVRVSVTGPSGVVHQRDVSASGGIVSTTLDLDVIDIEPGSHSVRFDLLGRGGEVVTTKSAAFEVVDTQYLPRPALVYRNLVSQPEPEIVAMVLSDQYLGRGDLAAAEQTLSLVASAESSRADMLRWKLATVLLYRARGAEALELLEPLEAAYPNQPEVIEGLGFGHYLVRDCRQALPRFEHAMTLRPPDIAVLNASGDCYQKLERADKAREMFALSLSVNPDQDGVRLRLSELQNR